MEKEESQGFVKWFSKVDQSDLDSVGEKAAKLGELFSKNLPVPNGFVITSEAYYSFLKDSKIDEKIKLLLKDIDFENEEMLQDASKKIQSLIKSSEFSEELKEEIIDSYSVLGANKLEIEKGSALDILNNATEPVFVSVRSSVCFKSSRKGTREQDTYLNIKGNDELLKHIKGVFASLFNSDTLKRELSKGTSLDKFSVSAIVQRMVESEKSGFLNSRDSLGNISIYSIWGLGEGFNVEEIHPDKYVLSRELEIVDKSIGEKNFIVLRDSSGSLKKVKSSEERKVSQVLNNYELQRLGDLAEKIESHFESPQQIEFAIDESGIHIMQSKDYVSGSQKISKEERDETPETEESFEVSSQEEVSETESAEDVGRVEKVTKTKLKLLLDSPYLVDEAHSTGLKKVGLVKLEKIIEKSGKHPYNFLEFHYINEYENLIYNGLVPMAENFEEVWVRTSDFLSSEFSNLEGGKKFAEKNPLLGLHGVRFGLKYPDILEGELRALKRLSEKTEVGIILPNIISVEELNKVKKILEKVGLNDVNLGLSIDNPAAIQLIKEFCNEGINLVVVNTEPLIEHLLAIDLSNESVKNLVDVLHPSFIYQLEYLLRVSKRNNVESGVYCAGPHIESGKKELLEYLIKKGVDFILATPEKARMLSEKIFDVEDEVLKGTDSEPRKYEIEKAKKDYFREESLEAPNLSLQNNPSSLNLENSSSEDKVNLLEANSEEIQKQVELIEEEKKEYLSGENLE